LKLCIILRGLPGSIRDDFSLLLRDSLKAVVVGANVVVTDKYEPEKMRDSYKECFNSFKEALKLGEHIVVNNVNSKFYHYSSYMDLAKRAGFEVVVCKIPHPNPRDASKNANVPEPVIRKLMVGWED
jgi:predicted kinase